MQPQNLPDIDDLAKKLADIKALTYKDLPALLMDPNGGNKLWSPITNFMQQIILLENRDNPSPQEQIFLKSFYEAYAGFAPYIQWEYHFADMASTLNYNIQKIRQSSQKENKAAPVFYKDPLVTGTSATIREIQQTLRGYDLSGTNPSFQKLQNDIEVCKKLLSTHLSADEHLKEMLLAVTKITNDLLSKIREVERFNFESFIRYITATINSISNFKHYLEEYKALDILDSSKVLPKLEDAIKECKEHHIPNYIKEVKKYKNHAEDYVLPLASKLDSNIKQLQAEAINDNIVVEKNKVGELNNIAIFAQQIIEHLENIKPFLSESSQLNLKPQIQHAKDTLELFHEKVPSFYSSRRLIFLEEQCAGLVEQLNSINGNHAETFINKPITVQTSQTCIDNLKEIISELKEIQPHIDKHHQQEHLNNIITEATEIMIIVEKRLRNLAPPPLPPRPPIIPSRSKRSSISESPNQKRTSFKDS